MSWYDSGNGAKRSTKQAEFRNPMNDKQTLMVQLPDAPTRKYDLSEKDRFSMGRSSESDIVLSDRAVSRNHAELRRSGEIWFVKDLGSTNGTELNGETCQGEKPLSSGDRIGIGPFTLVFSPSQTSTRARLAESGEHMTLHSISLQDYLEQSSPTHRSPRLDDKNAKMGHFLRSMDRVGQALVAQRPIQDLLDLVVDLVHEVMRAERVALFMIDETSGELVPSAIHDTRQGSGEFLISNTIAQQVIAGRESILSADAMSDDRFQGQASIANLHIHSALCAPLWNENEVIGIVYADNQTAPTSFSQEDLHMITLIAHLVAVKIQETLSQEELEKGRRMQEELRYASEIQRKLLPPDTVNRGSFHIGGVNVPSLEVGGDYYDYFDGLDNRLWVALGDVSGKGMSAALLMSNLHASLRAQVEAGLSLIEVMPRLNNAVRRSTQGDRFITLFIFTIDPDSGEIEYINAGHNPPMLLRHSGEIELLETGGLFTGVFPDVIYDCGKTSLQSGDVLLLYSDGVTEGRDEADEEFGEERLAGFLKQNRSMEPQQFAEKLIEEVRDFCLDGDPGDDVTALLVTSG